MFIFIYILSARVHLAIYKTHMQIRIGDFACILAILNTHKYLGSSGTLCVIQFSCVSSVIKMSTFSLSSASFETSALVNELKLIQDKHGELFKPRSIYEEEPGLTYEYRVAEQISKHGDGSDTNPEMDLELRNNAVMLHESNNQRLPIDSMRNKVAATIRENKFTVIVGGTGSGKSTRVPQIILQDRIMANKGSACRIICTQPRRVAATSIAKRVAFEMGEDIGKSVGYAIRGDVVECRKEGASIMYCTSGVLVRKLIDDPALIGISHVIVDEIHERSLELEMLLRFLKELAALRPKFKLIVMSATMQLSAYKQYLEECPVVQLPDSVHPVTVHYLDDMPAILGTPVSSVELQEVSRSVFVITCLVDVIVRTKPAGAILIFVPGWGHMNQLHDALRAHNRKQTDPRRSLKIRLLHSKVPLDDRKIFDPIKGPGRKVLISTTIAESSITVPDVVYVIDLGRTNVSSYHEEYKWSAVQTEWTTQASAAQRKGRAGRVAPGTCYRLYSRWVAPPLLQRIFSL